VACGWHAASATIKTTANPIFRMEYPRSNFNNQLFVAV
jgi:hypothetical protein